MHEILLIGIAVGNELTLVIEATYRCAIKFQENLLEGIPHALTLVLAGYVANEHANVFSVRK